LKGLLKGFWWPFRLLKLVKYSWSSGPNEVCDTKNLLNLVLGIRPPRVDYVEKSYRYYDLLSGLKLIP